MSNGGGIIVIRNLRQTPGVTTSEQADLTNIEGRYEELHGCSFKDTVRVLRIIWRLLRP